jgi:hypothetical protein
MNISPVPGAFTSQSRGQHSPLRKYRRDGAVESAFRFARELAGTAEDFERLRTYCDGPVPGLAIEQRKLALRVMRAHQVLHFFDDSERCIHGCLKSLRCQPGHGNLNKRSEQWTAATDLSS